MKKILFIGTIEKCNEVTEAILSEIEQIRTSGGDVDYEEELMNIVHGEQPTSQQEWEEINEQ